MRGLVAGKDLRSDLELVKAVNAGDWDAFDALYHRHCDWAYRLAWRFAGDPTDALDAVQEVFVYLAKKFHQPGGLELTAGITTLLYPAVKHTALAIKRKRRQTPAYGIENEVPAPPPGPRLEQTRLELAEALSGLSDAHREVLLMRFVDDMTLEEIAQALQIPIGTAKSRLHHAIAGVRHDPRMRRYFSDIS